MTCEDFDKQSISTVMLVDNQVASKITNTWERAVNNVDRKFPNNRFTNEAISSLPTIVLQACNPKHFSKTDKLGNNIETLLIRIIARDIRTHQANQNDCSYHEAFIGADFNREDKTSILSFCASKDFILGSKYILKHTNSSPPTGARICSNKNTQNCISMKASNENFCLSKYGQCVQNAEGSCAWHSTIQSEKCLKDTSILE